MVRKAQCILFPPLWPPLQSFPWNGMLSVRPAFPPDWPWNPAGTFPLEIFIQGVHSACVPLHLQVFAELQSQQWCPRCLQRQTALCPLWNALFPFFVASKLLYDLFISYFWWLSLSLLDSKFHVAKYFYVCLLMCLKCLIHRMWSVKFFWINEYSLLHFFPITFS